jgi:DNA adenine methylase
MSNYLDRKDAFIKSLISPSSTETEVKYKRASASPLRYAGGKSLAVGFIAELLPTKSIKHLVSPFFGGGSFEISTSKALNIEVRGSDIFDLLVNYWQQHLLNPEGMADALAGFEPTPAYYREVRDRLKDHWKGVKLINDPLTLAATYYYNHNCSYGPHFLGHPSSVYLQEDRYKKMVEKVRNFKAEKVKVEEMVFADAIRNNRSSFLYCDPPYFLSGGMFIGMYPHRNFPIHHNGFDHELLRDLLVTHRGGWVLSYNDCPEVRELYKGYKMSTPKWQYTFGQGDTRLGDNRLSGNGTHIKKSHEILIWKDH